MDKMLGVMIDCSRNAVMKIDVVKKYVSLIKRMGYNTLMLYTEETYEIEGEPYFGHLRGRYSKAELKELDSFCVSEGIELIPCIQTLAHLENMFRWGGAYGEINDCANILLCDDEKTYELIDKMLATAAECFTSRKIHIGMDEADMVGLGKYKKLHGEKKDRFDIINDHLHRVTGLADKYGFEPMIWSDMFCRLALDVEDQYEDADTESIKKKAQLPENISLVYWDYYNADVEHYRKMIKTNKMFGRPVYFAGGAWTWAGFAPDNEFSIKTTAAALEACGETELQGVFMTMWGDNGSECSKFAVLPSLLYTAEVYHGNTDMDSIKAKFREIAGCDMDSFMLLDKINIKTDKHQGPSAKCLLYNDAFLGIRDYKCSEADDEYYQNLAEEISKIENKGEFKAMFDVYEQLARVLAIKSALGVRTRKAYLDQNFAELEKITQDYAEVIAEIKKLHRLHQNRWFLENKPHGFDVQDIRLGGLIQRLESCKERLETCVKERKLLIPELCEPVLAMDAGERWNLIASVNCV